MAGTAMPYDVKKDIWNLKSHILPLKIKRSLETDI